MKRVKAACILQTLVFMQKEDCGLSRSAILETNRRDYDRFTREVLPDGRLLYTYDNGSVSYSYEFTEL